MKTTKIISFIMAMLLTFSIGAMPAYAEEGTIYDPSFGEILTTNSNDMEIPEDAKVVEIIDLEIDEGGISTYSYYYPAAITLSASGNWYRGSWRQFDGNYIAYEVTAKYANGNTSNNYGLYIALEASVPAGDLNKETYGVKLDGTTNKYGDWRKIWGGHPDFRFAYYNATYGTSYQGSIWVRVKVYSWD